YRPGGTHDSAAHGNPRCAGRAGDHREWRDPYGQQPQPRLVAGVCGRLAGTGKPDRKDNAGVGDRRGRFAGRSSLVTSAGRWAADSWGAELRPQLIDDTVAGADGADTAG